MTAIETGFFREEYGRVRFFRQDCFPDADIFCRNDVSTVILSISNISFRRHRRIVVGTFDNFIISFG